MDDELPPAQPEPTPSAPPPAPDPAAAPPPTSSPPGTPPPPPGYAPPPAYGQAPPPPPGYGAPGYGSQAYGQPAYGYGAPRTEGLAVAALVTSIVGLFVCGVVTGIVALVLAHQASQRIVRSGGQLTGEGMVTAARIIAIISIVLSVIGFAFLISAS